MIRKICAANWKLNFTPEEARKYFSEWSDLKPAKQANGEIVFFPPAYNLAVAAEYAPACGFHFGPQNIYVETSGAFTGEISATAVQSMGAKFALIGHSERRTLFAESNKVIGAKIKTAHKSDLVALFCIGETLDQREKQQTLAVITEQLQQGLAEVATHVTKHNLIIAYEPVWAIGTGRVATPQQVAETHGDVRKILTEILADRAREISILYGGSVKPDNAAELAKTSNVDGFLVGGASLKPKDFLAIAHAL